MQCCLLYVSQRMDEEHKRVKKERKKERGSKKRNENASHQKIIARASSTEVAFMIEPNEIENNQVVELFSIQYNDSCVT